MVLSRNPEEIADETGIIGYARPHFGSTRADDGFMYFTPDGYDHSDMDHTYRIRKENLEWL